MYANPTIRKLSEFIQKSLGPHDAFKEEHDSKEARITQMGSLVQKYIKDLPQLESRKNKLLQVSKLNVVLDADEVPMVGREGLWGPGCRFAW